MNHHHIFPFMLFVFSALNLSLFAQDVTQFDNPGFEQWTSREAQAVSEPVHWHSSGTATGTFSGFLSSQIEASTQTRPGSSGIKSVRLYPTSVMGITANGNLTNGRMNAGSMSATGSNNYNYTQRSNSAFNTPIDRIPDSLVVWVCFRSESATQRAQIHAAIHGDTDYKFVADGTEEPLNMLVASVRHTFTRTSTANGAYNWCRLSMPFVKDGPCNDPRYILFTITTNELAGEGSTNDDLFVDDIELIYNLDHIKENTTYCSLFPNPSSDHIFIKAEETIESIQIFDLTGQLLRNITTKSASMSLSLGDLPSGTYFLRLNFNDKKTVKRIIKL